MTKSWFSTFTNEWIKSSGTACVRVHSASTPYFQYSLVSSRSPYFLHQTPSSCPPTTPFQHRPSPTSHPTSLSSPSTLRINIPFAPSSSGAPTLESKRRFRSSAAVNKKYNTTQQLWRLSWFFISKNHSPLSICYRSHHPPTFSPPTYYYTFVLSCLLLQYLFKNLVNENYNNITIRIMKINYSPHLWELVGKNGHVFHWEKT